MCKATADSAIGIFDSGVGGVSVLQEIRALLPAESLIYVADQAHVPYGPRPFNDVRLFAEEITHFLLKSGVKMIVVACNAASAAALAYLRIVFPEIAFVGMEPAVKPAAENTESKIVAVLATPATFQGALYASVVERFGAGVKLLQDTCPGLVEQIESGDLNGIRTRNILERTLHPMLKKGADTVVLGCTHYPFVIPLIQDICGPHVRVIDPAPAIARQVKRVLTQRALLTPTSGNPNPKIRFFTTGEPHRLRALIAKLIRLEAPVSALNWVEDRKLIAIAEK